MEPVLELRGREPTAADYPNLPYALAVFEETLRLYPPVVNIVRTALEPDTLAGRLLPGGSNVVIPTYALHRHPAFWDNPEGFDPTRMLPEGRKGQHRFAYIPFSAGPRFCIGESFAWTEGLLALTTIARRWRPRLVAGHRVEPQPLITLRPRQGIRMRLERR